MLTVAPAPPILSDDMAAIAAAQGLNVRMLGMMKEMMAGKASGAPFIGSTTEGAEEDLLKNT